MNKYSCTQILISIHMDRFAYMQNFGIRKLKFALGFKLVQISRICIWCKFCIRLQIHSHGQICTREYICIYANICKYMQICPCESTFKDYLDSLHFKSEIHLHCIIQKYTFAKTFSCYTYVSEPDNINPEGKIEPRLEKTCFCHMRTTKAQIRLRIRAF